MSLDGSCCGPVEAAIAASGLAVEHVTSVPADTDGVALVVVDRAARQAAGDALRLCTAPVVVVGDDLDDDALIALMLEAPVSHLVGDPSDRDLSITSEKLASGDLFGLEKYVAAGSPVGARTVRFTDDLSHKRRAVDEVCAWAESVGARRPTLHRITSVVDELLMNALRDPSHEATLRWAADATTLAISVTDHVGGLRQRDVIDHVRRARHERGRPNPPSDGGAGLGLYLVLANVAALVVNVDPGRVTEIVCLFDLARGVRPSVRGVRALHVFDAAAS
ncbi:MAG TPA: ATP-binding protein [Kofleriaceae bacterium]|nr:ATP-binding protein [Kofleriaceae bacterium]